MKSLFAKEEMYWNEKFDAEDSMSFLPYSNFSIKISSADHAAAPGMIQRTLPKELSDRIVRLANGSDMAFFMIVLAGVNGLLHAYTKRENVLVGIPASALNDENPPIQDFLIIKNIIRRESTFKSLLGQIKTSVGEALEHQHIPFRKMIHSMNFEYTPDGVPVVNTMVSFKKIHGSDYAKAVSADTVFEFDADHDSIRLSVSFDGNRYDQNFMAAAVDHLMRLLSVVLFQPELELGAVDMLSESEKHQLLHGFNDTETEYPRDKTIHQLIEEQAERVPDAVAVVFEKEQLTYRELNERANRLARTLRAEGVQPDQLVGLMVGRSLEMVVGILGILKAGGAYVPIDPEYPEERIRYLLEDSGALLLLTQRRLQERVSFAGKAITLDDEAAYSEDGSNLEAVTGPNDLAYVIYTSGTTGKPKGVLVEHRGLSSLKMMFGETLKMSERDRVVQFASLSFDASCWEIFKALFFGAALYIPTAETILDYRLFESFMNENGITATILPPTYAAYLNPDRMPSLEKLITGGSAVSVEFVQQWKDKVQYFNAYGPTEASIVTSVWAASMGAVDRKSIPIGRPIQNHRIHIVDSQLQLLPVGVAGELCVAGVGLARGYLNRPELTAEKFVDNPFAPGERMYRTGDLARWLPDGSIEYMGRIDHQVKIRGYRIEIGEVEEQLLKIASVQEAIVIAREDASGQSQLCAYFVAQAKLKATELKEAMAKELPGYMIPSHFVQLERMPLTPNGKIDRKALPVPEASHYETEYVAPRTLLEMKLVQIWQEVLGLDKIGIKDDFFELGGNSINLMRLIQRIYDETGREIPLHKGYQDVTIEAMALENWESGFEQGGNHFMKLNKHGATNLFCFPPGSGFGIGYRGLADRLENRYTVYAIDFIDDSENYEDMLNRYVDEVIRIQDQGPYIFLGYCFGGNLMFEVAKTMEKRGYQVSDLIMVDSWIKETLTPAATTENELLETMEDLTETEKELLENPLIRERVQQKVRATLTYEAQLINTGTVQGNVYELVAEDSDAFRLEHQLPSWRGAAGQAYMEYKLAGAHEKLLEPECIDGTSIVIQRILDQIVEQNDTSRKVLHGG
ncbi:plipastatin non-ribosomal peptide synthetase PpsE [Paenibacillus elgii]|uniref:non-ribosomal peptide synthetase n=1 Tax=Paenibacillus elgii TaxID=189691 RepID=UPI002D7ABB60|nr:plipastatin non-ribosomal peptide synthetase PpsE [Paenibacillus elgii]